MYIDMKSTVLLQTATATVYSADRPDDTTVIRLILDSGSQRSYITSKLRDSLRLPRKQSRTVSIKTFGSQVERVETCDIVELKFKDFELSLFTVPNICEPLSGQPINWAVERFSYLQGLDLADSCDSRDALEMSILVGMDQYWKVATGGILRGKSGPTAMETKLGWVLSGPVPGLNRDPSVACLTCTHVLKVDTSTNSVPYRLAGLERRLQTFWDLDTLGIVDGEDSVYDKFVESVSFQDGRYCVSLPWKTPCPMLPDHFELSQRRLFNLLKWLHQMPHVLTQYDAVIQEQIKSGVVEIVENPHDGPIGATHYIPHHAVIREDKQTTKMRIVYDASAKSTGPSLNDCLYAGPTFGQNIMDILLRFRACVSDCIDCRY